MQQAFGSGNLFGIVGPTLVPRKFGTLQDVSIDVSFTTKQLFGQNQFPVAIARGQGKITGKAKFGNLNGGMLNDLFFSQTNAVGRTEYINAEAASIPTTPFIITVANGATFKEDLGVTFAASGVPLVRVASAPTTGQYSVNATTGAYTFAAADTTLAVQVDYAYTVAAVGNTTTVSNLLMGTTPTFIASFPIKFGGKTVYFRLNACVSTKLVVATKIDDFLVPEFDFESYADASGTVMSFALSE